MTDLTKYDYLKHGSIPPADIVNCPQHYVCENVTITIEPIVLCEQCGFLLGNALKYLFRYQHKGKPLEDLKKAEFYLKRFLLQFGSRDGTDLTIFKFNYIFEAFKNKDFLRDVDVMTPPKKNIENILEWTQNKIKELEND